MRTSTGTSWVFLEDIVQIMHQTVREFFFRSNGCVASSKFRMNKREASISISVTLLRYLMLCKAETSFKYGLAVDSWTPEDFQNYALYLESRPLAYSALRDLHLHISGCEGNASVMGLVEQLRSNLESNLGTFFFFSWANSLFLPIDSDFWLPMK
jgi:hypothetical protein